jgi:DnaK suppressor protein
MEEEIEFSYFKKLLTNQLAELLMRADRTVGSLLEGGSSAADPLDRATLDSERDSALLIHTRENHLIEKIKVALDKIDDGSFGICEECGEPIPLARLKARPVTAYCIECKTRMELREKAIGL